MQNKIDLSKSNIISNVYFMLVFQMKIKQNDHSNSKYIDFPNLLVDCWYLKWIILIYF